MAYVHGKRTWEIFINRLGTKKSNLFLDATRVFTFHLNLALNYKSITFSLCTFNLFLSFLASSGLLCLRFSIVETPWDSFGWGNYNTWLQPLFIEFYNTTPFWTMRWFWPFDGWRILIDPFRNWSPWSKRILDFLIFRNKPALNRN